MWHWVEITQHTWYCKPTQLLPGANTCLPALLAVCNVPGLLLLLNESNLSSSQCCQHVLSSTASSRKDQHGWKVTFLHFISVWPSQDGELGFPGTYLFTLPFQPFIYTDQTLLEGNIHELEKCLHLSRKNIQRRETKGTLSLLGHFRACYGLDSSGKVENEWSLPGLSIFFATTLPLYPGGPGFYVGYQS